MKLSEYPRPQFKRDSYFCLHGEWDYAITKEETLTPTYEGKINVPFSPEAKLSGVNRIVQPDEFLIYHRTFKLPKGFIKDKVLLQFLGVDQIAKVYLNGEFLTKHVGGYTPFTVDITEFLQDENDLIVVVKDYTDTKAYSHGKQTLHPGGIWYTPQSGIYLPVFIESVSNDYIEEIKITPNIDTNSVNIKVKTTGEPVLLFNNKEYPLTNNEIDLVIENPILWSPENPHLYDFQVKTNGDLVSSYFGMRKVSKVKEADGQYRIYLNNERYFMKGLLDQGYFVDGLLTPPSYSDYEKDILAAKALGFNTLRKHIKVECPYFYYLCDKLGMLVWQDFVSGGYDYSFGLVALAPFVNTHRKDTNYKLFRRTDKEINSQIEAEFVELIKYLYNYPSIVLWTIFNEGWGQFDSVRIYNYLKDVDKTRLFDHASGWHDQGVSDVKSLHVYFRKVKMPKPKDTKDRAVILSECGGLQLSKEKGKRVIFYKRYTSKEKFIEAYEELIKRDIIANINKGLCAFIYTQLSDVEDEINGFLTYDRKEFKVDPKIIKEINDKVIY